MMDVGPPQTINYAVCDDSQQQEKFPSALKQCAESMADCVVESLGVGGGSRKWLFALRGDWLGIGVGLACISLRSFFAIFVPIFVFPVRLSHSVAWLGLVKARPEGTSLSFFSLQFLY